MKPYVVFFSPTGGTKHIAQHIADRLGTQPMDVTVFGYDMNFDKDSMVFFCFPVYGGRIPKPMYDRMRDVRGEGAAAVPVAVFGNRAVEDALMEMGDLCREKGFILAGAAEMVAPHSLNKKIAADRPDASDLQKLDGFVDTVMAKDHIRAIPMPGSRPYKEYKGVPATPVSGSKCTGCGTCASECPAGALEPGDPHMPDKSLCISCMRCVNVCPFGNRKVSAPVMVGINAFLMANCSKRREVQFYL